MPESLDSVAIIFYFILPGYIIDWIISSFLARGFRAEFHSIISFVGWSGVSYAISSVTLARTKFNFAGQTFVSLILIPALLGLVAGKVWTSDCAIALQKRLGFKKDSAPKAWDHVFCDRVRQIGACYALITLTDNSIVGAYLGDLWHASEYPSAEDLYIEEVYTLDENGRLEGPADHSCGMWIKGEHIKYIEFFKITEQKDVTANE